MIEQSLKPESKPFFIGIDSDGTVFNSMEIKHKRVFQPTAVEIWGLDAVEGLFNEIAESINLYSVHRGVNRFQGLAMAFDRLSQQSDEGRLLLEGYEVLQEFVDAGGALSIAALAIFNRARKSNFLNSVMDWSLRSDQRYAAIMKAEGNPPYAGVHRTLSRAFSASEIVVVSSSSRETLEKDWGDAGFLEVITQLKGQEQGNKTEQLETALGEGRDPLRALMIGDALGDLEAARAHGIHFYPITPGAEVASWERLEDEAIGRFLSGTYAGSYEEKLVSSFERSLLPDAVYSPSAS